LVWLRHLRWSDRRVGKGDDGRGDPGGGAGVAGVWTARLAAISERSGAGYVRMAEAATFATNPSERFADGLQAFLDSMRRQLHKSAAATTTNAPRRRASARSPKAPWLGEQQYQKPGTLGLDRSYSQFGRRFRGLSWPFIGFGQVAFWLLQGERDRGAEKLEGLPLDGGRLGGGQLSSSHSPRPTAT
jgi:hypothetical protein